MVIVVDLDIGNLQSIINAFRCVGVDVKVAATPDAIRDANVVILPGVGAFGHAMGRLNERGFRPALRTHVHDLRRPLVGICLGMQLLADRSYEHGRTEGLGFIEGEVIKLEAQPPDYRVPNIGWVSVSAAKQATVFPTELDGQSFYHVHSYHLACKDSSDVAATIRFGDRDVVTAVERANVLGVQFHPEKSQDAGLNLLSAVMTRLGAIGS